MFSHCAFAGGDMKPFLSPQLLVSTVSQSTPFCPFFQQLVFFNVGEDINSTSLLLSPVWAVVFASNLLFPGFSACLLIGIIVVQFSSSHSG